MQTSGAPIRGQGLRVSSRQQVGGTDKAPRSELTKEGHATGSWLGATTDVVISFEVDPSLDKGPSSSALRCSMVPVVVQ